MAPGWVEFEDINQKRPVAIHLATGLTVRPDIDRPSEVTILAWQHWRNGVAVGTPYAEVMAEIERVSAALDLRHRGQEAEHAGR